jgi:hypothetical protein
MLEPAPCSTQPCIDPIFGPTQAHFYWSSTTVAGGGAWIGNAWIGNFYQGNASLDSKTLSHRVRAVRGPS